MFRVSQQLALRPEIRISSHAATVTFSGASVGSAMSDSKIDVAVRAVAELLVEVGVDLATEEVWVVRRLAGKEMGLWDCWANAETERVRQTMSEETRACMMEGESETILYAGGNLDFDRKRTSDLMKRGACRLQNLDGAGKNIFLAQILHGKCSFAGKLTRNVQMRICSKIKGMPSYADLPFIATGACICGFERSA